MDILICNASGTFIDVYDNYLNFQKHLYSLKNNKDFQ